MPESYNRKIQKKVYYKEKKSAKTTAAPTAPTVQKCMCGVEVHIKSQLSMRSHHTQCTTYKKWFHEGATTRKEPHIKIKNPVIVNTLKQDTNSLLKNDTMVDDMILDDYVQDVNYVEEYIANNDNADDDYDDDDNDSDGDDNLKPCEFVYNYQQKLLERYYNSVNPLNKRGSMTWNDVIDLAQWGEENQISESNGDKLFGIFNQIIDRHKPTNICSFCPNESAEFRYKEKVS